MSVLGGAAAFGSISQSLANSEPSQQSMGSEVFDRFIEESSDQEDLDEIQKSKEFMQALNNGDITNVQITRRTTKKHNGHVKHKRYNSTRKAPGPRRRALWRKKNLAEKRKIAKKECEQMDMVRVKAFKTKRPPPQFVEDRENMEVDDLTQPTVHKKMAAPPCNEGIRMYPREDWRDNFKNEV